jgi:hypothetical protein
LRSGSLIAAQKNDRRVEPPGKSRPGLDLADWLAVHQQVLNAG